LTSLSASMFQSLSRDYRCCNEEEIAPAATDPLFQSLSRDYRCCNCGVGYLGCFLACFNRSVAITVAATLRTYIHEHGQRYCFNRSVAITVAATQRVAANRDALPGCFNRSVAITVAATQRAGYAV